MTETPPEFVTYQLAILLAAPASIMVGRLGVYDFPVGRYIYTGSARRNLEARIKRHLRCDKRLHWRVDYLLALPLAEVIGGRVSSVRNATSAGRVQAPS